MFVKTRPNLGPRCLKKSLQTTAPRSPDPSGIRQTSEVPEFLVSPRLYQEPPQSHLHFQFLSPTVGVIVSITHFFGTGRRERKSIAAAELLFNHILAYFLIIRNWRDDSLSRSSRTYYRRQSRATGKWYFHAGKKRELFCKSAHAHFARDVWSRTECVLSDRAKSSSLAAISVRSKKSSTLMT